MAKQKMVTARFDFRGGLNTAMNPDLLQPNELQAITNMRIDGKLGTLQKRLGTRKLHETALGASVTGLYGTFKNSSGARELLAMAGGNLYYKDVDASEFGAFTAATESGGSPSTTTPSIFVPFRSTASAAELIVVIADGDIWDYTSSTNTITKRTGTTSVPNGTLAESYHTRMWYNDTDFLKHLFWSDIGDHTTLEGTGVSGGGSAIINIQSGESIVRMINVGGSLLVFSEDAIARITGYSNEDINVQQDTEGLSSLIGVVGRMAVTKAGGFAAFLSELGAYLVSEGNLQHISHKIDPTLEGDLLRTALSSTMVGFHKARKEIWFFVPGSADAGNVNDVYIYSMEVQGWFGPFTLPFNVTSVAEYEDASGNETLIAGSDDGFVYLLDTGTKDSVLFDGTGGTTFDGSAVLAPVFFESGPGRRKLIYRCHVNAVIPVGTTATLQIQADGGGYTSYNIVGTAAYVQSYRVDTNVQGARFDVKLTPSAGTSTPEFYGMTIEAYDLQRPA